MIAKPAVSLLALPRLVWLWSVCSLVPACAQDTTGPAGPRYVLTFDDGEVICETSIDTPQVRLVMQDTLPVYDISWAPERSKGRVHAGVWGSGPFL